MSNRVRPVSESGAPRQMEKLRSMIGEWDVQFETRGSPDESFAVHQITSSIVSILGGAFLQEHLSIPASSGRQIELMGLLGYDRFRETYRFAWLDDTYAVFDVHEGNWDGAALVVNNLRSRTTFRFGEKEYFSRMMWHEIIEAGFKMESHLSLDEGNTWFVQARCRYFRRV